MALLVAGIGFLALMFAGAVGSPLPRKLLPGSLGYFTQITKLFPWAATAVIDYRAEGWLCAEQRFVEIDVRPHFPIHPDDKENRFARALFFHRRDRPVLQALDTYLVERHNARVAAGTAGADAPPGQGPIGGVRFSSMRLPVPPLGARVEAHSRAPMTALVGAPQKVCPKRFDPQDAPCVARLYWTRPSQRPGRCLAAGSPKRSRPAGDMEPEGDDADGE